MSSVEANTSSETEEAASSGIAWSLHKMDSVGLQWDRVKVYSIEELLSYNFGTWELNHLVKKSLPPCPCKDSQKIGTTVGSFGSLMICAYVTLGLDSSKTL